MWENDYGDDDEQPTRYAAEKAFAILRDADREMGGVPKGYEVGDCLGGARIEWWRGKTACVILVVGHDPPALSYIMAKYRAGQTARMFRPATAGHLAFLLRALGNERAGHVV